MINELREHLVETWRYALDAITNRAELLSIPVDDEGLVPPDADTMAAQIRTSIELLVREIVESRSRRTMSAADAAELEELRDESLADQKRIMDLTGRVDDLMRELGALKTCYETEKSRASSVVNYKKELAELPYKEAIRERDKTIEELRRRDYDLTAQLNRLSEQRHAKDEATNFWKTTALGVLEALGDGSRFTVVENNSASLDLLFRNVRDFLVELRTHPAPEKVESDRWEKRVKTLEGRLEVIGRIATTGTYVSSPAPALDSSDTALASFDASTPPEET